MATGKTSRASFQQYVAQDAYFLRAFAKAYAYALTKVKDEEGVRAFHSLIGSVLEELSLHASYSLKWGVDLKNVSKDKDTIRLFMHVDGSNRIRRRASSFFGTAVLRRVFSHFTTRKRTAGVHVLCLFKTSG